MAKFTVKELEDIIYEYKKSVGEDNLLKIKYSQLVKYAKSRGIDNIIDKDFSRKPEIVQIIKRYNDKKYVTNTVIELKEKPLEKFLLSSDRLKGMEDIVFERYIALFNETQKTLTLQRDEARIKRISLEKELAILKKQLRVKEEEITLLKKNHKSLKRDFINTKKELTAESKLVNNELGVYKLKEELKASKDEIKELRVYLDKTEHLKRFEYISKIVFKDMIPNFTYKTFIEAFLGVQKEQNFLSIDKELADLEETDKDNSNHEENMPSENLKNKKLFVPISDY